MKGCVRRVVALFMLLLLLAGAWLFRDRIRTAWDDWRGNEVEVQQPSPELAAGAERKLLALRDGSARSVSLSALELESLLLHHFEGVLPAFLDSPQVAFDGDRLRLRARVPIDKLPRVDGFSDVVAFLPDTTELAITGKLLPLASGRVGFGVDDVRAARVPLPNRFITGALTRLGRRDEVGLPTDAIAFGLPPGVTAAYIRADSLVLLGRAPPGSDN